jgi:hypothetical protein
MRNLQGMRAKVQINNITQNKGAAPEPKEGEAQQEPVVLSETITFVFPAKDGAYPADGSDEDQQFAKYSPSASLQITVANPALIGKFEGGDKFYLDFVPIDPNAAKAEDPATKATGKTKKA